MAIDRVMAMRRVLMYEPHRYRHIVGPAASTASRAGSPRRAPIFSPCASCTAATAACSRPGAISTASTCSGPEFNFLERIVVLDSQKIDTLLVIPL